VGYETSTEAEYRRVNAMVDKLPAMARIDERDHCAHQFDDWSNAHVIAPFEVCRHCGQVAGVDMRVGATATEFKAWRRAELQKSKQPTKHGTMPSQSQRILPVLPTPEMLMAGNRMMAAGGLSDVKLIWQAMLGAADGTPDQDSNTTS
jgi:hypothetical protein